MSDALNVFLPLFGFMLLPVWIPILGVSFGWIVDQFGGNKHDQLVARFAAVKERSHAHRVAIAARHEAHAADRARQPAFAAEAA